MARNSEISGIIYVGGVVMLIIFLSTSTVLSIFPSALYPIRSETFRYFIYLSFQASIVSLLYNYYLACFVPAGKVPLNWYQPSTFNEMFFLVVNSFSFVILLLFIGLLAVQQTSVIIKNTTTIEKLEIQRVKKLISEKKIDNIEYPYTLDTVSNLKTVFGSNLYLLFPFGRLNGNGIDFPVNNFGCWPPDGYYKNHPRTSQNRGDSCITRIIYSNYERVVVSIVDEDGETVIKTFSRQDYISFVKSIRNGQFWLNEYLKDLDNADNETECSEPENEFLGFNTDKSGNKSSVVMRKPMLETK
ncbi:Palmitoyltransferase PFA4 [Smittium culicis]|uniref:Palmitoyltransferase PFA4 n=1 Tax=Smittium culicis TaxID=133412 RepID=A0A1R1XKM2_9FUNG|nr:Palmitoyltransferase PFA4 [Smittium culicis]